MSAPAEIGRADAACEKARDDLCSQLAGNYFNYKKDFEDHHGGLRSAQDEMHAQGQQLHLDGCGKFHVPTFTVSWA